MVPDIEILFEVRTPLGFPVRVTRTRWQFIATLKHPVMAGRESSVRLALESPDEVRQSRIDSGVVLFYRAEGAKRWVCAVTNRAATRLF